MNNFTVWLKSVPNIINENYDASVKQNKITVFVLKWDKRQNIKHLGNGFYGLNSRIELRPVCKLLARANAQRCDKVLPTLDWILK